MDLWQLKRNVKEIDAWDILSKVISKHFDELTEAVQTQLSEGENATGFMPDYRSEEYAHFKQQHVPTYNIYPTVDLRLTGDFYKGLKARLVINGIEIESIDSKAIGLEKKYGSKIYVLNTKRLEAFIDSIIEEYRDAILKQLSK